MNMTTMPEIRALLNEGMEKLGVIFPVEVFWSNHMKKAIGIAFLETDRIKLSVSLWPLATEEQRRETVLHELCHLVATRIYGCNVGHKTPWKNLMRRLGLTPNRCHTVPVPPKKGNYKFTCACPDRIHYVGKVKAERHYLSGEASGVCKLCRARIALVGRVL